MISPGEHLLDAPGADWQGGGPDRRSRLKHVKAIFRFTDLTDSHHSHRESPVLGEVASLHLTGLARLGV